MFMRVLVALILIGGAVYFLNGALNRDIGSVHFREDGVFVIDVPEEPTKETFTTSEGVVNTQYTTRGGQGSFIISTSYYPGGFREREAENLVRTNRSFFEALNGELSASEKFSVVSSGETDFRRHAARIDEVKNKNVRARYLVFSDEKEYFYTLVYSAYTAEFSEEAWEAFINSFEEL